MAVESDYEVLERLGEGAFGKVYKARHRRTGDLVAVKWIKVQARSWDEVCRSTELQALRALRHPFLVKLRELIRSQLDGSTYYIFEFIDGDLCKVVKQNPQGLDETRAADLARQIFAGLAHIHLHNFFHRDIKPENILFETTQGTIRIADFGEARSLRSRPPFTDYVGTRWYRAPECLLRDRAYSSPVDVWAAGLVLAELLRGSPVLCGTSGMDQLCKIIAVLGEPYTEWPEFARLAGDMRFRVPEEGGLGWKRIVHNLSTQAVGILNEILIMNPRRRPPARRVMESAFFADLPPLDLPDDERPHRDSQASRPSAAFSEERPRSTRLQTSPEDALLTKPQGSRPTITSITSPAQNLVGLPVPEASEEAESRLVEERALEALVTAAPTPDIDLDAELDKILGPHEPTPRSQETDGIGMGGGGGASLPTSEDLRSVPLPTSWPLEGSITGLTGLSGLADVDEQPLAQTEASSTGAAMG